MRTATLAKAKATLSALVNDAQHHGRRTVILRHGKPSAAIVPVDVAIGTVGRARAMSEGEATRLLAGFGKATRRRSAVADLLNARR